MANGRGGIQVIPTLDRFAGLRQGALNLVGGLNQQFQQQQQISDNQALVNFMQQQQQGLIPQVPQFQTPQGSAAFAGFLGQQTQQPFTLAPGAQRFDAQGRPIAQAPPRPPSAADELNRVRLKIVKQIQEVPEEQRTAGQRESLKRLLEGQAAVQISLAKPAAASERTAIAETNASLDALANLENLFNKVTTVTGPVAGRVQTAKGLFGLSSEDQENLLAATAAFKNKVIKDITGAQMSEAEANRIMKQIPLETDPPARWKAKKKQTEINLRAIQRRRIQVLEESGLRAPGVQGVAPLDDQALQQPGAVAPTGQLQPLSAAEETRRQELLRKAGR